MLQLRRRGFQCLTLKSAVLTTDLRSYGTGNSTDNVETPTTRLKPHRASKKRNLTMVSTTRGAPSTSNDLKEALCEKIPLHYDLLRKFKTEHGSSVISEITVNDMYNGLKDVSTVVRETAEIHPLHGITYRGLTIPEVLALLPRRGSAAPSPEAVFWLLLTGDVPTIEQTASLVADWNRRRGEKKNSWLDPDDDNFVGRVVRALPKNLNPLEKFSIAITALDASATDDKKITRPKITSYANWERIYDEGMDILATLPAIVGLVKNSGNYVKKVASEDNDWVDYLVNCTDNLSNAIDETKKNCLADFLRLYMATNADEDGGSPAAHVTEIMGATEMPLNRAFAAGVLAHRNEPSTGSMIQCMDFQLKIQRALGREPNENALREFVVDSYARDNELTGHKEGSHGDPRYVALLEFVRARIADNSEINLSREISRVMSSVSGPNGQRLIWPQQSTLAAPIFRSYGLKDMEFNQVLLCMSRGLGAVASIIWNRAIGIPIERPKSRCTHNYVNYFLDDRSKLKKIKRLDYERSKSLQK